RRAASASVNHLGQGWRGGAVPAGSSVESSTYQSMSSEYPSRPTPHCEPARANRGQAFLAATFLAGAFFAAVFLAGTFLAAAFLAGARLLAFFCAGPRARRSANNSAARESVSSSTESPRRSEALVSP